MNAGLKRATEREAFEQSENMTAASKIAESFPILAADGQFLGLLEAIPTAATVVNDQGTIVLANRFAYDMFGYQEGELVGRTVEELMSSRFREQHQAHRAKFATARSARPMGVGQELHARRKDGTEFPVEIGLNPINTPNGSMVLSIVTDLTLRKQNEAKLQASYEEMNRRKLQIEQENVYLRTEFAHPRREIVGQSGALTNALLKASQVAETDSTVLIQGETGTGKELIARFIHENSRRKGRTMIKVNCAVLPAALVESELFGREKGAYTGALTREVGRFELANGSTIFLDEVGELPVELQAKLLRVLQEGEFERLGNPRTIRVDVRVIAATARNLQAAVNDGTFRSDLFYRLNVFPIEVPPLRERREDIPALVWHFLREIGNRMGRRIETVRGSTMQSFQEYSWPGNVRELRNLIERYLITTRSGVFEAEVPKDAPRSPPLSLSTAREAEEHHLRSVLETTGWRIRGVGGTAEILGLKPTTLESRLKKLGISRHSAVNK